jgi:uncharacterized protein YbjT (DUF2867 family)
MNVLLFGATGAAGGAVLTACLKTPIVDEVRTIARRPLARRHPKLRSYTHSDFLNYDAVAEAFEDIDACLFCLGISTTQVKSDEEFRRINGDFALAAARLLKQKSPGAAFHYISGQGTNVNGRFMWQKVKGQIEIELMQEIGAVCWRPSAIAGEMSDSTTWMYKVGRPFFAILKPFRDLYIDGQDLGRAMLQATLDGRRSQIIENRQIREIAEKSTV